MGYFVCPNCGEDVKEGAISCPHCGSDEQTGWSENDNIGALDLPDTDDDDAAAAEKPRKPAGCLGLLLLALAAPIATAFLLLL